MLIARFTNSLLGLNKTLIFYRDFQKFTKHFFTSCLVWRDRQGEGRTLWTEFYNFGTPLQMRCASTEDQRNFWLTCRQCSRYHITVCQVNTDTHSVLWMTQMLWDREDTISNTALNFTHSELQFSTVCLHFLLSHYHFLPDTSDSL
jgi:hypothetical protein